jgi:WD40 repeat protein
LVAYAGGKCLLWHATSSKILARYDEEFNDLNTCEFTQDGNSFITAGSDAKVRLYDVGRKAFKLLQPGSCSEHKNRVFASKFAD